MPVTLYSYLNSLPELTGRVFMTAVKDTPAPPYAYVFEAPGGKELEFYGTLEAMRVFPRVALFDKPTGTDTPQSRAAAQQRLRALVTRIQNEVVTVVDTHADGVTPLIRGSFQRQNEPAVRDDDKVPGQSYATLMFTGLIWRA